MRRMMSSTRTWSYWMCRTVMTMNLPGSSLNIGKMVWIKMAVDSVLCAHGVARGGWGVGADPVGGRSWWAGTGHVTAVVGLGITWGSMIARLRGCQRKSSVTGKAVSLEVFSSDTLSSRSIACWRIVLGFALLGCLSFPVNKKQKNYKKNLIARIEKTLALSIIKKFHYFWL